MKLNGPDIIQVPQQGKETPAEFVEWFALHRSGGREHDVGMYRHWVDPTIPFAATLLRKAHGVLITSASLRDQSCGVPQSHVARGPLELNWSSAK